MKHAFILTLTLALLNTGVVFGQIDGEPPVPPQDETELTTIARTLGNDAPGFESGASPPLVPDVVEAHAGQPPPFDRGIGGELLGDFSASWTFTYERLIAPTFTETSVMIGLLDHDSVSSGEQAALFELDGNDLTADLNRALESISGESGEYHILELPLPRSTFADLVDGEATFSLRLQGPVESPVLPVLGGGTVQHDFNGAHLIFSTLRLVTPTDNIARDGDVSSVTIQLVESMNLMSVPLAPESRWRLSDLAAHIGPEVNFIVWHDKATRRLVSYFPDFPDTSSANKPVEAGDGYVVMMSAPKTVTFIGQAWGSLPIAAAPSSRIGTPLLVLDGVLMEQDSGRALQGFQLTATNRRTGQTFHGISGEYGIPGRVTVVLAHSAEADAIARDDVLTLSVTDAFGRIRNVTSSMELPVTDNALQTGIIPASHLRVSRIPETTMLLANYPNPFNPETWIPYQLAKAASVTIHIYDARGQSIRTLDLGLRAAGIHRNSANAAYWDGRNASGESVASGVYFYQMTAGAYAATRRMVILK